MEDLNKTQMVLLCLLVSFVTSIGTGIITTSLLREVPQNVTQTINRVVERTVETIVPQAPNTVTREVTVVVKEEDLIIDSINKTRGSLVRIVQNQTEGQAVVQSVGVVIKKDGTILADKRFVIAGNSYNVIFSANGESYPVAIVGTSEKTNAVFLTPVIKGNAPKNFIPAVIGKTDNPQLGQTVIAVGGKEKEAVAIGRIGSVSHEEIMINATTTKVASAVEIDTPLRDLIAGSILLNLNGEMIGFENFEPVENRETFYAAIGVIKRENSKFFE